MLFKNRITQRTQFTAAMVALSASLSLQLVHPHTPPAADALDGIRGALLGITIGLLILNKLSSRKRSTNSR